ncbi:hypothetical protein KC340_g12000 [Hortaea werneckii]|nr:hypothetical protein KC342_g12392 [Hortaea werneckii]KAI7077894.1 hypothetical protein KC339_g13664 [Hortaea werneckii]KAI7210058.1 hypothetical protein KC365_g15443 [Hortaea werneckii]KAI7305360.1 hypothetical protein KC340_g12000 [Hortaea werneckii]KAI7391860.1 hypothetical protein KC328_g7291 [Hortaea werneckii]
MDGREVEIVDLTGDENLPPRQEPSGLRYPVATERSLGKRPAEPSTSEPLRKVRRPDHENEHPPPEPSMSHGTVRQKMMTAPFEAGQRLHERARNDRSLREAMDALVAGTATPWQQALFERAYNEMMMMQATPMPSLPPPQHLSSMRDKSLDRLLSVDGLIKCVLQQADGPAPNIPYGPQAQCVVDRLCFDLPRELFEKLRDRAYGFPGLDCEVEEYDFQIEYARRAVNAFWPDREPIPYTSAVETALAERYQQSKQTLKEPWTGLSHIETDSLDQAILPKSLKWIVRRSMVRSKYWEDLNNAEFIRQVELRYRSEPEHNAILHATAQGFNLEHPSFDRLLDSALFHWTVIPEDDGIMRISEKPASEYVSGRPWVQPMRAETPTVNFLRESKGQDIPDFEKAARNEDTQDDSPQNNSWVPWYTGGARVEEESWSKQPIELGESSPSDTSSQNQNEGSSASRPVNEEDGTELQRSAQQSPSDTEDVRGEQSDKSPADIDELSNEDLQILATRIKITRDMSSFTSSDPIVRELVVQATAEPGFAQTLDQVAQGNDNTTTKRTPLETFRQAIKAIKQDIERPPAMRGLPEPLSPEQWPLKVSPQYTTYMKRSTEHGHRMPIEKRPTKYLAHPDSFIQMHWKDHHDVAYPLTLLPKATWNALHHVNDNKPHSAVCARCRRPRQLSSHDRKLFLTAERLSWPRLTFGYKARTGIEEALWPVNFELGVEEPVQFSMHHDIFSAKKSVKNKFYPYSDSCEAEMVMRVVEHAEILTNASWELWSNIDQQTTTPVPSQHGKTGASSARPPLGEISDNARLQAPPTPPSSATKNSKAPESASISPPSMSLVEMYSSLDKIERSSPMASRFLEAYAEKLHAEVCKECWVEENVPHDGDDEGEEGGEGKDEGQEEQSLHVW